MPSPCAAGAEPYGSLLARRNACNLESWHLDVRTIFMKNRDTQPWKSRLALLAIYLFLAALLAWAATAPLNRFTGTLAALIVLGCWIPGYVYVNRSDIRSNRVFWISHGIAFVATAAWWVIIMPNQVDVDDAIRKEARSQGGWPGIALGVFSYLAVNLCSRFLANRVFGRIHEAVERKLEGRS